MEDLGKKPEESKPVASSAAGGAQARVLLVLADGCGKASQQHAGGEAPEDGENLSPTEVGTRRWSGPPSRCPAQRREEREHRGVAAD